MCPGAIVRDVFICAVLRSGDVDVYGQGETGYLEIGVLLAFGWDLEDGVVYQGCHPGLDPGEVV